MKSVLILLLGGLVLLVGCGPSEPSSAEVSSGAKESFYAKTGFSPSAVRAKKSGNGRWSVDMDFHKNGESRRLHATAILDDKGDIHYYTD